MKTHSHKKAQKTQKRAYITDSFELFAPFCGYNFLFNTQVEVKK